MYRYAKTAKFRLQCVHFPPELIHPSIQLIHPATESRTHISHLFGEVFLHIGIVLEEDLRKFCNRHIVKNMARVIPIAAILSSCIAHNEVTEYIAFWYNATPVHFP